MTTTTMMKELNKMETKEINDLAIDAQRDLIEGKGRTENVWYLIAIFTNEISRLERIHGNQFNNEIAFVERCEQKIEYAAKAFNSNIQDFEALVTRTFDQAVKDYHKRRGGYKKLHCADGDEQQKYVGDPRISIEDEVVSEEFYDEVIDEYATDDKRGYILSRWAEEGRRLMNTELAREMIVEFGGRENTHVQFIKRFRNDMRTAMA